MEKIAIIESPLARVTEPKLNCKKRNMHRVNWTGSHLD